MAVILKNSFLAMVIFVIFVSFPSFSESIDELVERDGLYFKKFTNIPFTGDVDGQSQGAIINGIKEGNWLEYHDNGQLHSRGRWKNGKKEGIWFEYHKHGKLHKSSEYSDGEKLSENFSSPAPILPYVGVEDQYRFALGLALRNDLATAETAFTEFRELHPDVERAADALFWLGRVQFMQSQYENAAMTFRSFNKLYPNDARLADTTLWIAEAVAMFANDEEACKIYQSLSAFLNQPPDSFTNRLGELSVKSGCEGNLIIGKSSPTSVLDVDLLRSHISKHWSPPAGVRGASNLKVDIFVRLERDGKVISAEIVDKSRLNRDKLFNVAAQAARNAILEASPLPLPAEKYELWKEFIFGFDPTNHGGLGYKN